jgi:hypothetical protein
MTIKLKDAGRVAFGVACPSGTGQTFTVAVEVKVCEGCEPERYRFLKEHQIHDTCPPERWPTPVELAAFTQAVTLLLGKLDCYINEVVRIATLKQHYDDVELDNSRVLGEIRTTLQIMKDGLERVACHS